MPSAHSPAALRQAWLSRLSHEIDQGRTWLNWIIVHRDQLADPKQGPPTHSYMTMFFDRFEAWSARSAALVEIGRAADLTVPSAELSTLLGKTDRQYRLLKTDYLDYLASTEVPHDPVQP